MKQELKPRKYAIAYCSANALGLILSDAPQEITYSDGSKGTAWTGVHLRDCLVKGREGEEFVCKAGSLWSARNPRVVSYLDDSMLI